MAIEKKLIHFGKLADFETQLNAGNILNRSIVFIQDAKKIWTHGTYYDCSEGGGLNTYTWGWDGSASGTLSQEEMDAIASADAISIIGTNTFQIISTEIKTFFLNYLVMAQVVNENGFNLALFSFNQDTLSWTVSMSNIEAVYGIQIISENEDGSLQCASGTFSNIIENVVGKISILGHNYTVVTRQNNVVIAVSETNEFVYDNEVVDFGYGVIHITDEDLIYSQDAITFAKSSAIPTKTSQLENDSNFVSSDGLKTINGQSIVGEGGITIEGGSLTEEDIMEMGFAKLSNVNQVYQSFVNGIGSINGIRLWGDLQTGDPAPSIILKTINGESILGSGDITISSGVTEEYVNNAIDEASNVYTTDFTVGDIWDLSDSGGQKQIDINALIAAIESNKIILIPADYSSVKGVTVASYAHMEDFIYLHFTDSGFNFYIELLYNESSITENMISVDEVVTMTRVNDAIANAITTTLNTPV